MVWIGKGGHALQHVPQLLSVGTELSEIQYENTGERLLRLAQLLALHDY